MTKLRFLSSLCLYFIAFVLSIWAEDLLPENQCFLMGTIVEISAKLTGSIVLCLLALFLSHCAEKKLFKN